MIELALLPILGVLQGGLLQVKHSKFVSRVLIAVVFALLYSKLSPWLWLSLPITFFAMYPGLGQPEGLIINDYLGKDIKKLYGYGGKYGELEKWQWEELRFHGYLSLAVRGSFFINPCFIIANPLAMWLGLRVPYNDKNRNHEALFFTLAYLMTFCIINMAVHY